MCHNMGPCGRERVSLPENEEKEMAERTDSKVLATGAINGLVDTFRHTLDPKKRLTIPSEWRDALKDPQYVYVLPSATEECLELIPAELMERMLARYQEADFFDDDADSEAQAIAAHAQMLKVDGAGRIRIGDDLLAHAGIQGGVTMIGGIRKAKLWAIEKKPAPKKGKLDLNDYKAVVAKRKAAMSVKKEGV